MEQKFNISGVNISVVSADLLCENEKWKRFASAHSGSDLTFRIRRGRELPELSGTVTYEDRRVRCFEDGETRCRAYLNSRLQPYCLARESAKDCWEIYVRERELPWGSAVSHYFESFDLTHALLPFGVLLFHCAYILTPRGAILFTAPSGTGKSTQAGLWEKHRGARIINGDRAALRCRGDALWVGGLPFCGSSDCCENVTARVLAVVGLSQAKENSLSRLQGSRAVQELLRGVFYLPEHLDELPIIFDEATKMVQAAPVYHLACLPDASAVELLEAELEKIVLPNI